MRVIILAAGQGKRLLPLTADLPKALLDIGGKPLLQWQIEAFAEGGVKDFTIVTGYASALVEQTLARIASHLGIAARTVFNPFFALADNLASCWMARTEMTGPFIQVNGDNVFRSDLVARLLKPDAPDIGVAVRSKESYDDDDMKVILDGAQLRSVGKKIERSAVNGEAVGFYRFSAAGAALYVKELDLQMKDQAALRKWFPAAIDALASKTTVGTIRVDGTQWCEVDFPEDLAAARDQVAQWSRA